MMLHNFRKNAFIYVYFHIYVIIFTFIAASIFLWGRHIYFLEQSKYHELKARQAFRAYKNLKFTETLESMTIVDDKNVIAKIPNKLKIENNDNSGIKFLAPPNQNDNSGSSEHLKELTNYYDSMYKHHKNLQKKYLRASNLPWLPISDDPKPPSMPQLRGEKQEPE